MSTRIPSERRARRAVCVVCALFVALTTTTLALAAEDDPMAPYRERFKAGMDRYQAGDFAAAIGDWEAIYRDVGPDKGYRVAFDLARAYDKAGDAAHAADRYSAFLRAIDARRTSGAALAPIVLTEETEARTRMAQLPLPNETTPAPSGAPIPAAEPTPSSQPAVVAPVAPPAPPLSASPALASAAKTQPRTETPFPEALLFVAGGATVAAIAVSVVEYARALSAQNSFNAAAGNPQAQEGFQSTYDGARPIAYGALGSSIGLAAITTGLGIWYFAGTKTHEVSVAPVVSAMPGGAQAGAIVRF